MGVVGWGKLFVYEIDLLIICLDVGVFECVNVRLNDEIERTRGTTLNIYTFPNLPLPPWLPLALINYPQ